MDASDGAALLDAADGGARDADASDAPAVHPYVQAVLADGPSLYFRLEETTDDVVIDEMGNHPGVYRPGSIHGAPGAFPGSLALRQMRSGGIDTGDLFDFAGRDAYTLEGWFRPEGYDGGYRFLFHHDDSNGKRQNYGIYFQASQGFGFERYVDGAGRSVGFALPTLNQWHHIAGVYTGTTLLLYVDGQLVGATGDSRAAREKATPLRIAYGYPDGDGALYGTVDELAIYEKALGQDRIQAHVDAAK